jgi:alpha-L-rhamnosidase
VIRREFIRLTSLAVGALPFVGLEDCEGLAGPGPRRSSTDVSLYEIFREPSNQYRPMVRWWWNGDRVVGSEILRELDVLQAAGIGGVEINPIRFPAEANPMNTKALTWMSDAWIQALEVALKGTKERGMICDMIVGSGWPYGGEFLTREDQTQMVTLGTKNYMGPAHVRVARTELLDSVNPALVSPYKDSEKELFELALVPSLISATTDGIRMEDQAHNDFVEFDVPAGGHVLYFLVKLTGFMAVINGAPGATGPVLNHYSEQAVARYLDRLSTTLSAKIGPLGDHFRAFFTDSIELEGANWCDDMFAEFRRRRGYDLSPWLPFVLFKVGEMGNAVTEEYGAKFSVDFKAQVDLVRYDFETTKHELFQDRFVGTFANWCKKNGVKSRMQAYGMDCDAITAGMMIDIPECETWIQTEQIEDFGNGDYRRGRSYTMINKFVSSSAHLAGKQLISCEEMTNTADPFHASLERIKVAGDQSILSGVTQSVLHGFNYSPPDIPFPGWVRYGTYFSERNTWWPYVRLWTDYKARLSALFQHCVMQADIAILPPSADLASKYGFQRDPFPKVVEPQYLYKLWEVIHQNGSGCDYLTEEIINKSTVVRDRLVFRDRSYKVIFLPEVESIRPGTATVLEAFVKAGGTLVFLGKAPSRAPGLLGNTAQSDGVHEVIASLQSSYPRRTPVVAVREEDMVNWYRELQREYALAPDVFISEPTDSVSQLHYVSGNRDLYFFSNYGTQAHTFEATIDSKSRAPWSWDPESGKRELYPLARSKDVVTVVLGPSESKLIVFDIVVEDEVQSQLVAPSKALSLASRDDTAESTIVGPWSLSLVHVNGTVQSKTLKDLVDLSQDEDLRFFAGTMIYSNQFWVDTVNRNTFLDLGQVRSISRVAVNGRSVGIRWYGDHRYAVSDALKVGKNELTIQVVSTLGNYMKSLTTNETARVWSRNVPFYPLGLTQPVRVLTVGR